MLASSATTNVLPGPPVFMIVNPPDEVDGDDAVLVARARGGDGTAFEGLVRRHYRMVYLTLPGVLADRARRT